jgi:hypothetical protein
MKLRKREIVLSGYTGCIKHDDGTKEWYQEGKYHKEDGPAIEYASGSKFWFIEDKIIKTQHGVSLTPGKVYKLIGKKDFNFFRYSNYNEIRFCLCLGNREEKGRNSTYFFSKVLLNDSIFEMVFENKTFEELG